MDYKNIVLEYSPGICLITMNNPQTLNALSDITVRELHDAVDEVELDSDVRVVMITGSGKAFVAGADIAYMSNLSAQQAREFAWDTTELYRKLAVSKKVFIAAVNGFALGGGCELALACDLRIASEYAKFGLPEVGLGILPGGGGTQRLSRLIGIQKAKEMILTGDLIKADEALQIGLTGMVVPAAELMDCTKNLAQRILKNSPLAVKYAKECIQQSQLLSLNSGIEFENSLFGLCFAAPDQKEGMAAFLQKRKPEFQSGF